jgi:hypothetical protein
MADPNLLASILSGQDALAAQMVPGYQIAQRTQAALDAGNHGETGGILGGLGHALMGLDAGMLQPNVQNVVNQRVANQGNLAKLLATPDPYAALANASPGQYSPLSAGAVLAGASPEAVADARLKGAQGQFFGAKALEALAGSQPPPANMYSAQPGNQPGSRASSANLSGAFGNPRYPQDPLLSMTPQQVQATTQDPQKRAALLAQLRARMAQRPTAAPPSIPGAQ